MAGIVSASLRPDVLLGGEYGTAAWTRLLEDPIFIGAVVFTLRAALLSTTLSILISIPLAFALRRRSSVSRALVGLPIPVPHLVTASLIVLWVGPGGLLDRVLFDLPVVRDSFGLGVVLVYVLKEVPFLTLLVLAALGDEDRAQEEAARTLSASRWNRWRSVLLPQLRIPLTIGSLVVAAFVVGSTEVPLVVGPLSPDALTVWSINVVRIRGPIARADAAAGLVVTSVIIILLAVIALWFAYRRGARKPT